MANRKWKARIRLPSGKQQDVLVDAPTQSAANELIAMQYAQARLVSGPNPA